MNKKLIISLSIIGVVAAIAIGGTVAYFSDVETSAGNTFGAGTIDLKIDLQCENGLCSFPLRDLSPDNPHLFSQCDIKPGDTGEVTISWHVYDNNAWGRIRLAEIYDWEYGCTDSEIREAGDTTCDTPGQGQGELSQYLEFTLWMDEGMYPGWQCPDEENGPCEADPEEGDDILNGIEQALPVKTVQELLDGVVLPEELEGSTTYYLGMQWEVAPSETDDIIQGDSLSAKIIMEVVQSRNNPNPWTP